MLARVRAADVVLLRRNDAVRGCLDVVWDDDLRFPRRVVVEHAQMVEIPLRFSKIVVRRVEPGEWYASCPCEIHPFQSVSHGRTISVVKPRELVHDTPGNGLGIRPREGSVPHGNRVSAHFLPTELQASHLRPHQILQLIHVRNLETEIVLSTGSAKAFSIKRISSDPVQQMRKKQGNEDIVPHHSIDCNSLLQHHTFKNREASFPNELLQRCHVSHGVVESEPSALQRDIGKAWHPPIQLHGVPSRPLHRSVALKTPKPHIC
mmetsp:Transcript_44942/g.119150  ORF Transcript_44942/g.119150 Transcript_44942/m.119150 type:complete len:263 (-) Transcript_44942:297-1085(-)